ncbi:facilitated trehalose transporter Tret1-like [Neodiprion virginianus]|uniref:facilitated trehalose transporter Tret1-like n=1 Tax=Neodiprion virginianus TaxID=2961670 RepID=UPI001EE747F8|nr:facilitated trehalose transporter Tret1-like [Neodiprion virginianus]
MVNTLIASWRSYPMWLQWVASIAVMFKLFVCGLSLGWASPYTAQFLSGDSPFPATTEEVSWISSMFQLGRIPGAILAAIGVQYLGSKKVLIGNGLAFLIFWILSIAAYSVPWLYVTRFICGAGTEAVNICYPIYLGDISSPEIRGTVMVLAMNGLAIGSMVGFTIGPYVSMRVYAYVGLVPTVIFLAMMLLLPDSPYYLARKKKFEEAEKSILAYNRKAEVDKEVKSINAFVAETQSMKFRDRLRELNLPCNRNATMNLVWFTFFAQFTGANPISVYLETISTRAMLTVISASSMPLVTTGLSVLGGWLVTLFADKWQRTVMWVISNGGVGLCMTAMGLHFYLLNIGVAPNSLQWLFILSMGMSGLFYSVGTTPVPHILLGELFGARIRTLAVCICCSFGGIFGFLSIYIYQYLIDIMDEAYVYWIVAVVALLAVIYGVVMMPPTKGKSLTEIQTELIRK